MSLDLAPIFYQGLVGINRATYILIAALGLTLIFGVVGVVNFAHGSFYMLGAYFTGTLLWLFGGNFWLSIIIAPFVIMAVGGLVERFLLRPLYRFPTEFQLLLTYALVLVFYDGVRIIWGTQYFTAEVPEGLNWSFGVPGGVMPFYNVFIMIICSLTVLSLYYILFKTSWGMKVRVTSMDRDMASAVGINVKRIYSSAFMLGIWLAAFSGSLIVPRTATSPGLGDSIIIESFAIVVVGGLGSLRGAILGSMIIGLFEAYGLFLIPGLELAFLYIPLLIILIVRPRGLFGKKYS